MNRYFSIDGYYIDDKNEFNGYIVKEFDDIDEGNNDEDNVFFYGLSEDNIKQAIIDGEDGAVDFVITDYHEIF